jgi:RNA-directed DNA polymerase
VHRLLRQGYTDVVDADLSRYFDTIPHAPLMRCVARRIVDRHILRLIKMWLRAPVEERDEKGKLRLSGGKSSTRGTPQGGVVSPMLANLYMNRLLKHWRNSGQTERLRGQIIAYADDFVVLSRGGAAEALGWIRNAVTKLDLALNESKTSVRNARRERFDFLGYAFGPHWDRRTGQRYLGASPSKKSVQRIKDKIGAVTEFASSEPWPKVRDRLNRLLAGWSAYFSYGTRTAAYRAVDDNVYDHVRNFLARRHKSASRGTRSFSANSVFGELGVLRLRNRYRAPACART